jgi:hypothetical protein
VVFFKAVGFHHYNVGRIRNTYPDKDFAFAGVVVKESLVRGMSDYINFSGPFTTYTVYTLEDGSKVFSRGTGTSQSSTKADGTQVVKFSGSSGNRVGDFEAF